jgi:hypothetical protein
VRRLSRVASLDHRRAKRRIRRAPELTTLYGIAKLANHVHHFEESIAGRDYLIEVKAVSQDRWSAYIVRIPGVPTALMPFYGRTPAEAAQQLSAWLTRAHQRAGQPSGTV